ncbi:hypothetical protein ZIOFF_073083 [Zingiber officinale]|uniref:Uncharacterized protein n=1 Tax=Zingiber officinale TaxID=94328 RepID=A0A8J5BY30_ZINOF|nr:hypothetical protein ZIOFF_073083 [Zingiber officinale]
MDEQRTSDSRSPKVDGGVSSPNQERKKTEWKELSKPLAMLPSNRYGSLGEDVELTEEGYQRSAMEQKKAEEDKISQAIDYDGPVVSEENTIGFATKVGVGVAVTVFGLVFAFGDFLPYGSHSQKSAPLILGTVRALWFLSFLRILLFISKSYLGLQFSATLFRKIRFVCFSSPSVSADSSVMGRGNQRGVLCFDLDAAKRAAGVGFQPPINSVEVEGVPALGKQAELLGVGELGETDSAPEAGADSAQRGEAEEGERLDAGGAMESGYEEASVSNVFRGEEIGGRCGGSDAEEDRVTC